MCFLPGFYPKCVPCLVSLNSDSSPIGAPTVRIIPASQGGYDAHANSQWQRQDSNPGRLCSECLSTDTPSLPSSQRIGKACESRTPLACVLPPPPCAGIFSRDFRSCLCKAARRGVMTSIFQMGERRQTIFSRPRGPPACRPGLGSRGLSL